MSKSNLQRGQIVVIAGDTETAARALQAFDRTARCLKLMNQFSQQVVKVGAVDETAALEMTLAFARNFTAVYPEGAQQCIADQEMFRTVTLDPRAVI